MANDGLRYQKIKLEENWQKFKMQRSIPNLRIQSRQDALTIEKQLMVEDSIQEIFKLGAKTFTFSDSNTVIFDTTKDPEPNRNQAYLNEYLQLRQQGLSQIEIRIDFMV